MTTFAPRAIQDQPILAYTNLLFATVNNFIGENVYVHECSFVAIDDKINSNYSHMHCTT